VLFLNQNCFKDLIYRLKIPQKLQIIISFINKFAINKTEYLFSIFHLVPAGVPDALKKCIIGNQTTSSLHVKKYSDKIVVDI